jgi:hypothetical protein
LCFCLASLRPWSSYLCLPHSWDYRDELLCLAFRSSVFKLDCLFFNHWIVRILCIFKMHSLIICIICKSFWMLLYKELRSLFLVDWHLRDPWLLRPLPRPPSPAEVLTRQAVGQSLEHCEPVTESQGRLSVPSPTLEPDSLPVHQGGNHLCCGH